MLHNSLLIRDLLRETNNDSLHRARRDPHRCVAAAPDAVGQPGDFCLDGSWQIAFDPRDPGQSSLAEDLRDYLTRLGVAVATSAENQLALRLDRRLKRGFRLSLRPECIEIAARDLTGLWAGAVDLEREMGVRRGPFLPRGEWQRSPAWPVQISQAPWGANYLVPDLSPEYLSDDAFRALAHAGVNGMTLYGDLLCYVRSAILPELDAPDYDRNIAVLREASERAARYGISFYYVPVSPKLGEDHPVFRRCPGVRGSLLETGATGKHIHSLCSSDPTSLAFHAEVVGNLFREVPLLGGLILIIGGESYYHCYMRPRLGELAPGARRTNCPLCAQRPAEEVVAGLVGVTAQAVHRLKPGAPVLAWPYSAQRWSADAEQLGLIARLPADAGLHSEIDKDQLLQKDGYQKRIWDYSVDFVGPSERIQAQARATRARGLPFFIKSETALGLEFINAPYVPCLPRLAQKWCNVAALKPDGVLQSWMFFGFWGSRAEELGGWTCWRPELSPDQALRRIAVRDFGAAADNVLAAWERMSAAIGHLPAIPHYFSGPHFLGPAHPLLPARDTSIPRVFQGMLYYLQESEEAFSNARLAVLESLVQNALPERPPIIVEGDAASAWGLYMRELEQCAQLSAQALRLLNKAQSLHPQEAANLAEERTLVEFVQRTLLTALHTHRWLRHRDAPAPDQAALRGIAQAELENALAAQCLYADAPWLDLSLRRDGGFPSSVEMLAEKISILSAYLS